MEHNWKIKPVQWVTPRGAKRMVKIDDFLENIQVYLKRYVLKRFLTLFSGGGVVRVVTGEGGLGGFTDPCPPPQ